MNRLAIGVVCSLMLTTAAVAQEPVDLETITQIRQEGLQRSQSLVMFNLLTTVIGRLSATPSYRAAADWAVERLQAWGMENVHLESGEFGPATSERVAIGAPRSLRSQSPVDRRGSEAVSDCTRYIPLPCCDAR